MKNNEISPIKEIVGNDQWDSFLECYMSKTFFYSESNSLNKFKNLMPWEAVNNWLARYRLNFPRIRIFKKGKLISEEQYTYQEQIRRYSLKYLDNDKVQALFKDGASMVIGDIDELYKPLEDLSIKFEKFFGCGTTVNGYFSFHEEPAFSPHWDDHDVFVMQVHGKKKWFFDEDNYPFPLPEYTWSHNVPPVNFRNEIIMKEGDFLYLPRGWWHYAVAVDGPSAHLTIGVTNKTGLTFLEYLLDSLKTNEFFRKDFPILKSSQNRSLYVKKYKEILTNLINEENLEKYSDFILSKRKRRCSYNLPESTFIENKINKQRL